MHAAWAAAGVNIATAKAAAQRQGRRAFILCDTVMSLTFLAPDFDNTKV